MARLRVLGPMGACLVTLLVACGGDGTDFDGSDPNPSPAGEASQEQSAVGSDDQSMDSTGDDKGDDVADQSGEADTETDTDTDTDTDTGSDDAADDESSGSEAEAETDADTPESDGDSAQADTSSSADFCDAPRPQSPSSEFTAASGEMVCASCHGESGAGGIGPSLVSIDYRALSFGAFEQAVRAGVSDAGMPAYAPDSYSDEALHHDYAHFAYVSVCDDEAPDDGATTGGKTTGNQHLYAGAYAGSSCRAQNALQDPQLWRLTERQFAVSVQAIFGASLFARNFPWPAIGDAPTTIGMSNRADQLRIDSVNMERLHDATTEIVSVLVSDHPAIAACASGSDPGCVDELAETFGPQIWRRPLSGDESRTLSEALGSVRAMGATVEEQLEFVFSSLLLSHNFLFRYELGQATSGTTAELSPYEVASWLSYSLWGAPPDDALYRAAARDNLGSQTQIAAQVDRMMADARFGEHLVAFFVDFLKLDAVLDVDKLSSLNFTSQQRRTLLDSAKLTLRDRVSDLDADLAEVFRGNDFYVNNTIAEFFGVSGAGSSLSRRTIDARERYGILSHPAFLAVHANTGGSGIVPRGVFVLEQLLCAKLGDPPDDIGGQSLPEGTVPEQTSTRDLLFLEHSSQEGCVACHRVIDPAGYGFEVYDTLGRYRTHEKIGMSGGLPGGVPIDASGTLGSPALHHEIRFDDHRDYIGQLVEAPEMRACLTRRLVEYVVGTPAGGSCDLEKVSESVDYGNASIGELVRGVMAMESGRARTR